MQGAVACLKAPGRVTVFYISMMRANSGVDIGATTLLYMHVGQATSASMNSQLAYGHESTK